MIIIYLFAYFIVEILLEMSYYGIVFHIYKLVEGFENVSLIMASGTND